MGGDPIGWWIALLVGLLTIVTLTLQLLKSRKDATAAIKKTQDDAVREAWQKGWDARNDEMSLMRARLEDRERDLDRAERRVEVLEGRVVDFSRVIVPVAQQAPPPALPPAASPPALPPSPEPRS